MLVSSAASAGPMMPPGPSPESSFAGVWRVIDARAAPWTKAGTLPRAPLLEYAIEFSDRQVKGIDALACKDARYSSGVTYLNEAFGGALAHDGNGTMAKALGLTNPSITTLRVICGGVTRDLYLDDSGDMRLAVHDIVYTLERPTGMDPEQYKPGYSGPSFDCLRATRTMDRLICIDASLSKADSALGAAYARLKHSLSPQSFASVADAQKTWLAYLAKSCGANGALPAAGGERNNVADCVQEAFQRQTGLLSGLKSAKSGNLAIEPRARFRARLSPDAAETDFYPELSGGAQAGAFNAFVARTLRTDRWRTNDRNAFPVDVGEMKLFATRSYDVVRFDARIVSLQISTDDFAGGNHDALGQQSLTWDLAKGRPVSLADIFAPGSKWKDAVVSICRRDLQEQLSDRGGNADDADIPETVADGHTWAWTRNGATITFLIDTIGGMPGGAFGVDIPMKTLAPFLRPDAPVR
jgi:uncharacterized protein